MIALKMPRPKRAKSRPAVRGILTTLPFVVKTWKNVRITEKGRGKAVIQERDNPRYPPDLQATWCLCERCGEIYEASKEHICRKKNSWPAKEVLTNEANPTQHGNGQGHSGQTEGGRSKCLER